MICERVVLTLSQRKLFQRGDPTNIYPAVCVAPGVLVDCQDSPHQNTHPLITRSAGSSAGTTVVKCSACGSYPATGIRYPCSERRGADCLAAGFPPVRGGICFSCAAGAPESGRSTSPAYAQCTSNAARTAACADSSGTFSGAPTTGYPGSTPTTCSGGTARACPFTCRAAGRSTYTGSRRGPGHPGECYQSSRCP